MPNETHLAPPRYTIPDFFSSLLDYKEEVGTIVSAPGATVHSQIDARQGSTQQGSITLSGVTGVYTQRGCDYGAQTIQNLTSHDFGHRVTDSISQRDKAIRAIKKSWTESHSLSEDELFVSSPD